MGGVNASPRYVQEVGIGLAGGAVTDTTRQGGIVSIVSRHSCVNLRHKHWLTIIYTVLSRRDIWLFCWGMDSRSHWTSERHCDRCLVRHNALVGGALQAATQSLAFILVARIITGMGTGGTPL